MAETQNKLNEMAFNNTNYRKPFIWCFLGKSHSGKTVTARQIAARWKESRKGTNAKIIAFDQQRQFTDLVDISISKKDEDWALLLQTKDKFGNYIFKGSLLILDDYKGLLEGSQMDPDFYDVLALRLFDVIYITHSPNLILKGLQYWNSRFQIFLNEAIPSDFQEKIPQASVCQRASLVVNEYVRRLGGVDSPTYKNLYPNFPQALVTDESNVVTFLNMDEDIIQSLQLT